MHMINVKIFGTLFSFYPHLKGWLSGLEIHKMLVNIANWEDPDQSLTSGTALCP